MAYLVRSSRSWRRSSFSPPNLLLHRLRSPSSSPLLFHPDPQENYTGTRTHTAEPRIHYSPLDSNILRILRNQIEYQSDYAPPHEPVSCFNGFTVEDNPGQQWIRLARKLEDGEDIKIEATMFDGCVSIPKPGDDTDGETMHLHISVLIDISKGKGSETLEFVCSAWPECLKVQKVYKLQPNGLPPRAYLGPVFRKSNVKLHDALHDYLEARGINDDLSVFLHQHMHNKDRAEFIHWLGTLKTFVQR